MTSRRDHYDVVVVGGGHNALVAAASLSRAGRSVLVLERLDHLGGAAATLPVFAGHAVAVSRYADAVRVPDALLADLDLAVAMVDVPAPAHCSSREWQALSERLGPLVSAVSASLLGPVPREREIRESVDPSVWDEVVATPLSALLSGFPDPAVRAAVAAPALLACGALEPGSLAPNRAFLASLVTRARVPVGGAGAVSSALAAAAASAGAHLFTSAGVSSIRSDGAVAKVAWHDGSHGHAVTASYVLGGVAPWVLRILMGGSDDAETKPRGAVSKANLLVSDLPAPVSPAASWAAGFVVSEEPLQRVWCPSLLDRSGSAHVVSWSGLGVPGSPSAVVETISAALTEPLPVLTDPSGEPCVDLLTPDDVDRQLAMPGGHPTHGDLDWPWAPNRSNLDSPAARWGVQTDVANVFLCGAGARRGGGVTGLAGHHAAQAVLESAG